MTSYTITLAKGADKAIPLIFTDSTGSAVDLSSVTDIILSVKAEAADASAEILNLSYIGGGITFDAINGTGDGTDGRCLATFTEADTDALAYDEASWVYDVWGDLAGDKGQWVPVNKFKLLRRVANP